MSQAPSPVVVQGIEGLRALEGKEVGVSGWVSVDQDEVGAFADVTGDHQWIHVDVERARKESPFGGPIAHGYLVLSLGPQLSAAVMRVDGIKLAVNYGLEKVRFLTPVPSGARVRLRVRIDSLREVPMGTLVANDFTFELEGADKPACVAKPLTLYVE